MLANGPELNCVAMFQCVGCVFNLNFYSTRWNIATQLSSSPLARICKVHTMFKIYFVIILIFGIVVCCSFGQPGKRLSRVAINDSIEYVNIPELHLRVAYPKSDSKYPVISENEGAYFFYFYYKNEISIGIEFVTRGTIKARSDSAKVRFERDGGESHPYETDSDYVYRRNVFEQGIVHDYFDGYDVSQMRKYGLTQLRHLSGTGFGIEGYTYVDSFQVIVRCFSPAKSISKKIQKIFTSQLNMSYDDKYQDMEHELIYDLIRREFLKILQSIQIEKI